MKILDVHSHVLTHDYRKYLESNNGLLEDSMPLPIWTLDDLIAFMDNAKIDWTMMSVSSPHPYYLEDKQKGIELCRIMNESAAKAKGKYPNRIGFNAVIPLPDVDAAIEEAIYALDFLGANGIKLASNSRGQYLGDKALEPLFDELNKRNAIINIHPHRPDPMKEDIFTEYVIPMFEFLCDTTRAVINLIGNGVIERYPDVKIIVPHCGSFLPSIADRADGILPLMKRLGRIEPEIRFKESLRKLYYDTSGNPVPDLLPLLLNIASPEHIMYGSDYPFTPEEMCSGGLKQFLNFLEENEELSPYKEMICYKNAMRLFKLPF